MQDRTQIKWEPFNSVINSNTLIKELLTKKDIQEKPILSEDQINIIENKIFESFTNHIKVNLFIYLNNKIIKLKGFVNNINSTNKYITFNNTHIYFNQIINISNFFEEN